MKKLFIMAISAIVVCAATFTAYVANARNAMAEVDLMLENVEALTGIDDPMGRCNSECYDDPYNTCYTYDPTYKYDIRCIRMNNRWYYI